MTWTTNHNAAGVTDPTGKLGGGGYHTGAGSPGSLAEKLASRPGVHNAGALAGAIARRIKAGGK